jgi:heptosyltransferase-2
MVLDLQNNLISRMVRKCLVPKAWSQFDKFSPIAAGERTRLTIEAAGFKISKAITPFNLRSTLNVDELLKKNGWDGNAELVVLNPAGAFPTRNWLIENYSAFASIWSKNFPHTQFLIMGVDLISAKASFLKDKLGNKLINLVNKTSPAQAFAIIQKAKFILSEDSGLMHMAWVSGKPTLAIFGSTRSYWSQPLGEHCSFFSSSDLECGNCMREICLYGDNRCLTRYTPEFIFDKAKRLVEK